MNRVTHIVVLICAATVLAACSSDTAPTAPQTFERPVTMRYESFERVDATTVRACGCDSVGIEFCKKYPLKDLIALTQESDRTLSCARPTYALQG